MCEHVCNKSEPNLTVRAFVECTDNTKDQSETAHRWHGVLELSQVHHQKEVYFDGHDRPDILSYRNELFIKLNELDGQSKTCDGTFPQALRA